jgi:hypothetical protein
MPVSTPVQEPMSSARATAGRRTTKLSLKPSLVRGGRGGSAKPSDHWSVL